MDMTALIYKVLSNAATDDERQRLQKWIGQSEKNREEFENVKLLWSSGNSLTWKNKGKQENGFDNIRQKVRMKARANRRRRVLLFAGCAMLTSTIYIYISITTHVPEQLTFEEQPFASVIKVVEENYGVSITVEDKELLQCSFTGTFYEVDLPANLVSSVADAIGARYEVTGRNQYRLIGGRCR